MLTKKKKKVVEFQENKFKMNNQVTFKIIMKTFPALEFTCLFHLSHILSTESLNIDF